MNTPLLRRVEKLETDTGDNRPKLVWLNRGEKPREREPEDRERVNYVSWDWSGDNAA